MNQPAHLHQTSEARAPSSVTAFISIGSNIEPARHIRVALQQLDARYGPLRISSIYRNRAEGLPGEDFLNLVAAFDTVESPSAIVAELERQHSEAGRVRGASAWMSRTLDLDLLLYGDQVIADMRIPRGDIVKYSFVLGPLAELAPNLRHPVTGETMANLWARFDQSLHPLQRLPIALI